MAATNSFFEEAREQSQVKSAIVSKYFGAWAKVITGAGKAPKIAYLDLFAGPGRYQDGTRSTPVLVVERAVADPVLRDRLVCVFNDKDTANTGSLQSAILEVAGVDQLKHQPIVMAHEVGTEMVREFETMKLVPTLFFVDPWGYKGLSLGLVNSVVKDWACECIFFFNYNRIRMGLSNPLVQEHMDALFGEARAADLRRSLPQLGSAADGDLAVLQALCEALNPSGKRYILPFTFRNDAGKRTSHHLVFVSKHARGYEIMKDIMARESSSSEQGVASFCYSPADRRFPVLFEYGRPLDDLQGLLLVRYRGCSMSVEDLFHAHNVGTPYVMKNYQDAVKAMDMARLVETDRTDRHRRQNQCPPSTLVTFPR